MKKITPTQKLATVMILINVLVFGIDFLIFRYIKTQSNTISEIKNELDEQAEKESQYLSIKETIQDTKEDREAIDTFFVPSEGEVDFIELIEREGRSNGVTPEIASLQVDNKNNLEKIEILVLEVEVTGTWQSIYSFIAKIENFPYGIKIENAMITEEDTEWRASFVLRVPKLKKV